MKTEAVQFPWTGNEQQARRGIQQKTSTRSEQNVSWPIERQSLLKI
jgi:hypothetical protein